MSESDFDEMESYWSTTLEHYTVTEEESGLPAWAWALIGVGIGIVVVGAGLAVYFVLRAKKRRESEGKQPKMFVDTTDDRSVDVYADDLAAEPAPADEAPEAPAEAEAEETDGDKDLDSDDEAAAPDEEAAEEPTASTGEVAAPTGEVADGEPADEEKHE